MQIGVRQLAASLGVAGYRRLIRLGAIRAPVFSVKRAFVAPVGESNARTVANRGALGKLMEKVAFGGMYGITHKNYPELTKYAAINCRNARREIPLSAVVGGIAVNGSADFVFDDMQNKHVLSEYKISLNKLPSATDYLQAVIYAIIYNTTHCCKQHSAGTIRHKHIQGIEWLNPITGHRCYHDWDGLQHYHDNTHLKKIIDVYTDQINDRCTHG
ncbi:hypothetical protein F-LCD7_0467 [Faustovirus]|nr:hypothetical protein F-LCD7_0467 [Faustovirus]